jgi:hypothetical protein
MSTHTRGRCFARRGRRGGAVVAETPVTVTTLDEYCAANGIERIDLLKERYARLRTRGAARRRSLMAAGRIRLVYLELIFSEMYEGLPPFDLVYRFLVDRNFGLVALYNYHYSGRPHGAAGWCDGLFTYLLPVLDEGQ